MVTRRQVLGGIGTALGGYTAGQARSVSLSACAFRPGGEPRNGVTPGITGLWFKGTELVIRATTLMDHYETEEGDPESEGDPDSEEGDPFFEIVVDGGEQGTFQTDEVERAEEIQYRFSLVEAGVPEGTHTVTVILLEGDMGDDDHVDGQRVSVEVR